MDSGKMIDELRAVVEDTEALLRDTAGKAEPQMRELEARVRQHPWTALGIAAGIGLLAGILLSRK